MIRNKCKNLKNNWNKCKVCKNTEKYNYQNKDIYLCKIHARVLKNNNLKISMLHIIHLQNQYSFSINCLNKDKEMVKQAIKCSCIRFYEVDEDTFITDRIMETQQMHDFLISLRSECKIKRGFKLFQT